VKRTYFLRWGPRAAGIRSTAGSIMEPMERSSVALPVLPLSPQAHERCEICGLLPLIETARGHSRIVARSPAMHALFRRVARFAAADAPVVILGESGTGKEVVARALHGNSSRRDRPFLAVNVAALPSELLESELFGHVRGAFTGAAAAKRGLFEAADGGTLFLDEIAEMPLALQAKLLRVLQDGEVRRVGDIRPFAVDTRVVCATHRELGDQVRRGVFREDLYYRLKVLTVRVPPLRERDEDILPLADQFLRDEGHLEARLSPEAAQVLTSYGWPGNVRELASAMKHGAALAAGALIRPEDLPEELLRASGRTAPASAQERDLRSLLEVEREHILQVLDACKGSQAEAARVLGIGRNTLWRKLRSYAFAERVGAPAPPHPR
jgi:DNA-binding NtrC family response regulator